MPYRSLVGANAAADPQVIREGVHHLQLLGVRYYMAVST
jgi:hypothetical protein